MNIKKILAAATASVLTVSAMAVVASADVLAEKTANAGSANLKYVIDFSDLTEDQIKSITKIEAKIGSDTNFLNGCIGYNSVADEDWSQGSTIQIGDGESTEFGIDDSFVREVEAGDLAALDEDGNLAPYAEVQVWWVNGLEYDENDDISKDGTVAVKYVKLYAGDTVVKLLGDENAVGPEANAPTADDPANSTPEDDSTPEDSTPEESTPVESTPAGSTGDDNKTPVETGVKGIAAVLGVGIVAAGAMVVAKKRK